MKKSNGVSGPIPLGKQLAMGMKANTGAGQNEGTKKVQNFAKGGSAKAKGGVKGMPRC